MSMSSTTRFNFRHIFVCSSFTHHAGSRSIESSVVNSFNNEGNGLQDFSNSTIIVGSCSCTSTCVELKTHQTDELDN
ncbi:hypothetical protein VNO80_16479 [Phaseolus coccineus]|uniref:Uncharacterized protein n=1 Tax=Phaseolus coccineus TaxID=3886 RepID=A0AAN9MME7_PHACN